MKLRGFVRRACLWQLMEEGQLSVKQLALLIGVDTNIMFQALHYLLGRGLVQVDPVKVRIDGARGVFIYGLTRAGAELALTLEPQDATADGAALTV